MRGVLGETILKFKSPDSATPEDALQFTEKFIQQYKNDPLIVPAPAPHAIFTNEDARSEGRAPAGRQIRRAGCDPSVGDQDRK